MIKDDCMKHKKKNTTIQKEIVIVQNHKYYVVINALSKKNITEYVK